MSSRNHLIERYLALAHYPTLRRTAQETGIQVSRIFRIMKQGDLGNLKLGEWQIFARLACQKLGLEDDLVALAEDCLTNLSKEDLQDIIHFMRRALLYAQIKNGPKGGKSKTVLPRPSSFPAQPKPIQGQEEN